MGLSKGHYVALAAALVSGISVFYNSFAVKTALDPVLFAGVKNALAALMLIGLALAFGSYKEIASFDRRKWLLMLSIAIIGGSIPFALFFTGMSMVANASLSSFIFRSMFFAASAMAVFFLRERPRPQAILGVIVLLAANALLLKGFTFGMGEAMVLAATLMWAAESVIAKKALEGISATTAAAFRMGAGSAILLVGMALLGSPAIFSAAQSPETLIAPSIAISCIFLFLYISLWYRALSALAVSEATAILASGGVASALLSAFFLGKIPTLYESISLLLVAFGVALVLADGEVGILASYLKKIAGKVPTPWKA